AELAGSFIWEVAAVRSSNTTKTWEMNNFAITTIISGNIAKKALKSKVNRHRSNNFFRDQHAKEPSPMRLKTECATAPRKWAAVTACNSLCYSLLAFLAVRGCTSLLA